MTVLPLAYLGNVQYFSKLCFGQEVVVDAHEHYIKQSLRNRCRILTADGITELVVPVVKTPNEAKLSVQDTLIDNSKRWQHRHWTSLRSAYANSPYFEFYSDRFETFYTTRYDSLFELNFGLTELLLKLLGSDRKPYFAPHYIDPATPEITDLRHSLSDKPRLHRPDPAFQAVPYYQVFSEKLPFAENLSVADLLFCEGLGALSHLKTCVIK